MSKASVPTKCAKCGSEKIKHEELAMTGKWGTFLHRFDVYVCTECRYSELYYIGA